MLRLDPVLFEQVLFNLLDNAAKYAPPGSLVRIEARAARAAWFDSRCSTKARAFRPPISSASSTSSIACRRADRRRAGTGLGLAICRGFVEAMGGTIVAGNRHDRRGAVFTITLPVPAGEAAARERGSMTAKPRPSACWSSTTSRRSAAFCGPASRRRAIT